MNVPANGDRPSGSSNTPAAAGRDDRPRVVGDGGAHAGRTRAERRPRLVERRPPTLVERSPRRRGILHADKLPRLRAGAAAKSGEAMSGLSRSVAGRVAVVTGRRQRHGAAIAMLFGAEGARVAALDRNADGVAKVADAISLERGSRTAVRSSQGSRRDRSRDRRRGRQARTHRHPRQRRRREPPAPIDGADFDAAWT